MKIIIEIDTEEDEEVLELIKKRAIIAKIAVATNASRIDTPLLNFLLDITGFIN